MEEAPLEFKYKLIIFDCDGTLVDSEHLTNSLIAQMLTEHGIETTAHKSYELFAGKSFADIEAHIASNQIDLPVGAFEKQFRIRCTQVFEDQLQAIPGAFELLEYLDQKQAAICIASNGPQVKMSATLRITKLEKYFSKEIVFSAYDIQKWKPQPDLFLHAAKHFNVQANDCLVIEDSVSGIQGALNANMDVIAYNPHKRKDVEELCSIQVQNLSEIKQYLT